MQRPVATFGDVAHILRIVAGDLGTEIAATWAAYNRTYFDQRLHPVPITLSRHSPYGHWIGLAVYGSEGMREIVLHRPTVLARDDVWRAVLLHEMVHQFLFESHENAKHNGAPWRREIMRLSPLLPGGRVIWAGAPTVGKRRTENGERQSFRFNRPRPHGEPSLAQDEIAGWPDSVGLTPPKVSPPDFTHLYVDRLAKMGKTNV